MVQKRGVRIAISLNQHSGTIQDVPQIEALWIPDHVELSKSTETKVTLKIKCVVLTTRRAVSVTFLRLISTASASSSELRNRVFSQVAET